MILSDLPKEMLISIFSYIPWEKLVKKIVHVCVPFSVVIQNDVGFWKVMCEVCFPEMNPSKLFKKLDGKPPKKQNRSKWNTWKRVFVKCVRPGWKGFIKNLEKAMGEFYGKKKLGELFDDVTLFAELSCSICRDLKLPAHGGGDFDMLCYFFPIEEPDREIIGNQGYRMLCKKDEPLDQGLFESIKEEYTERIDEYKSTSNYEMCGRITREFNDRYRDYVMNNGLIFGNPYGGDCRLRGVYRNPYTINDEKYQQYFQNEDRKMKNFTDFVAKCLVGCRYNLGCTRDMKKFESRPSWGSILEEFSQDLDPEFFLPMYTKVVINVCILRKDGNQCQICAEGENGFYYFRFWTS